MKKKAIKIIVTIVSIGLLCLLVYFFGTISNTFFSEENSPRGELIKVILTFVAGIIAMLVWHSSYKRVKVMEKQTEKTAEQIQVMYKGNVDARFNNAIGHLGNLNPTVVLGGIHVLHQIAVEYENYTQIVHNVFCGFLRENSAKLYEGVDFARTPNYCPVIIQTLIDYLFRPYNNKDSVYKEYKTDLSFSTLKNCNFRKYIILKNVSFNYCSLERCRFYESTFEDCYFWEVTWIKCDFSTLKDCTFVGGSISECQFYGPLRKCSFHDLTFSNPMFANGCILTDCSLYSVNSDFEWGRLGNCTNHSYRNGICINTSWQG